VCSGFTGSCKLKNGQACTDDGQCASDYCDSTSSVCEP
jgi:hypothetical protein